MQHQVFGRVVGGLRDALDGYEVGAITIHGAQYRALRAGGAGRVEGLALRLTDQDLVNAHAYETDAYARIEVTLVSGRPAFVYVTADAA